MDRSPNSDRKGSDREREREIEELEAAWRATPGEVLVTVVLDMSGSMGSVWDETIAAFNEYVDGLKATSEAYYVSLIMFDNEYLPQYFNRPVADVPTLTKEVYRPRGSTALFDAMGRCITETAGLRYRPERVLVVTITDGQENSSWEFTLSALQELIRQRQAEGWEFLYLSAALDAFADAERIGIGEGRMLRFRQDASSMQAMSRAMDEATCLYSRTGRADMRERGYRDDVGDVPEDED